VKPIKTFRQLPGIPGAIHFIFVQALIDVGIEMRIREHVQPLRLLVEDGILSQ
jgi:hypothetical protein